MRIYPKRNGEGQVGANKGKLQSKSGVEGYHPDTIQYEQDVDALPKKPQPAKLSMSMQQCIEKVSSY